MSTVELIQQVRLAAGVRSRVTIGRPHDFHSAQVHPYLAQQSRSRGEGFSFERSTRNQFWDCAWSRGALLQVARVGEGQMERGRLIFKSTRPSERRLSCYSVLREARGTKGSMRRSDAGSPAGGRF
jgi:hypothetical protein